MDGRQEVLHKLVEILAADTEVQIDNLSEDLSLREGLGLDSVDLVGVIMRIEGHYRIRLSHTELETVSSVGSLLDLIEAKLKANAALAPATKAA